MCMHVRKESIYGGSNKKGKLLRTRWVNAKNNILDVTIKILFLLIKGHYRHGTFM